MRSDVGLYLSHLPRDVSGIYAILCVANEKMYIGSSQNIRNRLRTHINRLRKNAHRNDHLQNAWNLYEINSFRFEIVELCEIGKLIEREQFHIDSRENLFNLVMKAGSTIGYTHTEETRKLMSELAKKRGFNPMAGRSWSEPELQEGLESMKAKKRELVGPLSACWGIKHTEKSRANMAASHLGKKNPKAAEAGRKSAYKLIKRYLMTGPDGVEIEIVGMVQFCKDNPFFNAQNVFLSIKKGKPYKGYTFKLIGRVVPLSQ